MCTRRGLILFAHGSSDPAWGRTLQALAERIAAWEPALQVRCAFLERQAPGLSDVLAELAPLVDRLDVCPVFWAANGHVQRDLPALLARAREAHPGLSLRLLPVLSELPGMLDFLALTVGTLASTPDPAPSADLP
jgi:sirohydrochlorin cobaltochelatase